MMRPRFVIIPLCTVFCIIRNTRIQEVTFETHISRLTTGVAIRAFNKLKRTDKERRFSGTKRTVGTKGKGSQKEMYGRRSGGGGLVLGEKKRGNA